MAETRRTTTWDRVERGVRDFATTMATRALLIGAAWLLAAVVAVAVIIAVIS
jgi:hypothetical protein